MPPIPDLPIATASLRLRRLALGDAPRLLALSQEEGVRAWLPDQVYRDEGHAAAVTAALVAAYGDPGDPRRGPYVLGVEHRGALIGHVGLSPLDEEVEVGFAIARAAQGRGLAAEAVRAACDWAGDAFALDAVVAVAAAGNLASQAVLRRAGFVHRADEIRRLHGVDQAVVVLARGP